MPVCVCNPFKSDRFSVSLKIYIFENISSKDTPFPTTKKKLEMKFISEN